MVHHSRFLQGVVGVFTGFTRSMVKGNSAESAPAMSNKTLGNKQSRQPKNPKTSASKERRGNCISTGLLYNDVKADFEIHAQIN